MKALQFAAYKHRFQKRKDLDQTPYINHPINVAYILSNEAGIQDFDILAVGVLFHSCHQKKKAQISFRLRFYMIRLKILKQHLKKLNKNLVIVLLVDEIL